VEDIVEPPSPFIPIKFSPPQLEREFVLDYPAEAMLKGVEGNVEMNLLVDKQGSVKRTIVVKSSGYDVLDNAAIHFAKKLEYHPAMKQGKPIESWVSQVMQYQLVDKSYVPAEFIDKIQLLNASVMGSTGKGRERLLGQLLDRYEGLAKYVTNNAQLDYNPYIKQLIKNSIYEEWQELWNDWPLHYLVFHDFILSYPESRHVQRATDLFIHYINKYIEYAYRLNSSDDLNASLKFAFFKKVRQFVGRQYPESTIIFDSDTLDVVMNDN
jgi:TonB family protein